MAALLPTFSIVEFEDGVELLPTKWLDYNNTKAYWPKFKDSRVFTKAVEGGMEPDKNKWQLCLVKRIMYQTNSYEKGRSKLRLAEQLSDLGTENEDVPAKRVCFPSRKVVSDSESDSDLSKPESSRKSKPPKKMLPPFPSVPAMSSKGEESHFLSEAPQRDTPEGDHKLILRYLHTLVRNQSEIKIKINAIQTAVADIFQRLDGMQGGLATTESISVDLRGIFPIQSLEELAKLEKNLKEKNFESSLIADLSTYGGNDIKAITRNILKKCIANEVAEVFSWEGRKQKKIFSTLAFNRVIFAVVRKQIQTATDEEITVHIKNWLRLSKLRIQREQVKSNSTQKTVEENLGVNEESAEDF